MNFNANSTHAKCEIKNTKELYLANLMKIFLVTTKSIKNF